MKYDGNLTIKGGTITGGTFQTATSGKRITITGADNYLKGYDNNGFNAIVIGGTYGAGISCDKQNLTTDFPAIIGTIDNGGSMSAVYGKITGTAFQVTAGGYPHGSAVEGSSTGYGFGGYFNCDYSNSPEALVGYNSGGGSGSHGVRGVAKINGLSTYSGGLVAASNGFDFYADGAGTNYGPFTGAHDSLYLKTDTLIEGDIVVDDQFIARNGWSNTLFSVKHSTTSKQKNVIGIVSVNLGEFSLTSFPPAVFTETEEYIAEKLNTFGILEEVVCTRVITIPEWNQTLVDTYNRTCVNAIGEGQLNVCGENGNIVAGDYIVTSSTPGKGMKQDDDLLHNYTVAKARESVTFTSPTEIKIVACIYVCG